MSANLPALRKVKQEIAKEGVLPFSLFFASSSTVSHRLHEEEKESLLNHRADTLRISQGTIIPLQASQVPAGATRAESRRSSVPALDLLYDYGRSHLFHDTGSSLHGPRLDLLLRCAGHCPVLRCHRAALPPIQRTRVLAV